MASLQKKIKGISEAHISLATAPEVATSFLATLQQCTTHTAWFPFFINFESTALIILSLLFLFPVFIQLLSKGIRTTHLKLKMLHLAAKNKKGGDGAGNAANAV